MKHDPTILSMRASVLSVAFLCLAFISVAGRYASAQDISEDPEERFIALLEAGENFDTARQIVTRSHSEAVATEIAVWICYEYEAYCEGSDVYDAWNTFIENVDESEDPDTGVSTVVEEMLDEYDDEYLIYGIALYWCSPDAGYGCDDEDFMYIWSEFDSYLEDADGNPAEVIKELGEEYDHVFAELVAASFCGHETCFAEEMASLDEKQEEELGKMIMEDVGVSEEKTRGGANAKFANNPGSPKKEVGKTARCWFFKKCE